ncbi:MAG: O-acetyl-ADP-ribose deacetylase [Ruminiclostridium sp.]|nr:O-acetyl-ADP-ribose deacetylase [Ruminiclostridium sp.]
MPLEIISADITTLGTDAIVNAANSSLLGGGGVDGAIHRAAGPGLLSECRTLGGCETGHAKMTKGYELPAKYVIHTVGPVWNGGGSGEPELLRSCYRECLAIAAENKLESIAFPLISSGAYGYPGDKALGIAVGECGSFLKEHDDDMLIYIVVYDKASYDIGRELYSDIKAYIDGNYAERDAVPPPDMMFSCAAESVSVGSVRSGRMGLFGKRSPKGLAKGSRGARENSAAEAAERAVYEAAENAVYEAAAVPPSLSDALGEIDESFSEMLLRKIDELGMTDAECYKKANIDRKLFSKIRSTRNYHPKKVTVLAFAIALRLDIAETNEMLGKAGFTLSHSSKADIIVEYFITHGNYDVFAINEALFAFDQQLIGA